MLTFLIGEFRRIGDSRDIRMQEGGGGAAGRKPVANGDKNRASLVEIRRRRIEAARIQRIPRGAVRHEKCELPSPHDSAQRPSLLLAGIQLSPERVRRTRPVRIVVHDLDGEAAAEGGGGDRPNGGPARGSSLRIPAIEGRYGRAEGGAREEVLAGDRGVGIGSWG